MILTKSRYKCIWCLETVTPVYTADYVTKDMARVYCLNSHTPLRDGGWDVLADMYLYDPYYTNQLEHLLNINNDI